MYFSCSFRVCAGTYARKEFPEAIEANSAEMKEVSREEMDIRARTTDSGGAGAFGGESGGGLGGELGGELSRGLSGGGGEGGGAGGLGGGGEADLPRGKHRERHHVLGARAAVRARGAGACVWGSCYGLELGLELGLDDAAHRAA